MARWHEKFWGRQADAHLCVSKAMQDHLRQSWGINAIVFYDKAPQNFQPASMKQKHDLFQKLKHDIVTPLHTNDAISKIMGQKVSFLFILNYRLLNPVTTFMAKRF